MSIIFSPLYRRHRELVGEFLNSQATEQFARLREEYLAFVEGQVLFQRRPVRRFNRLLLDIFGRVGLAERYQPLVIAQLLAVKIELRGLFAEGECPARQAD